MNSPGGGVAASEEMYREVKRVRDQKKKRIVASIETVGASGAYYVSSATNKIYADSGSVVGSIGVISEWVNYGDLMRWAQLKPEVLKVGEYKDTGDPTREMTPKERAYLQGLIDNMYGQFVKAVAEGRHAKLRHQGHRRRAGLDRRTGPGLKMIDQIGDFEAAVDETAKSVGITGKPVWYIPRRTGKPCLISCLGIFPPGCPPAKSCWISKPASISYGDRCTLRPEIGLKLALTQKSLLRKTLEV